MLSFAGKYCLIVMPNTSCSSCISIYLMAMRLVICFMIKNRSVPSNKSKGNVCNQASNKQHHD